MLDDPVPLLLVDHLPPAVRQHARGARVQDEEARVSEVTVERPAARGRLTIPPVGEPAKERSCVTLVFDLRERSVLLELRWREVAQMLVEPVGHERACDPGLPPARSAHLLDPEPRDVPVVV